MHFVRGRAQRGRCLLLAASALLGCGGAGAASDQGGTTSRGGAAGASEPGAAGTSGDASADASAPSGRIDAAAAPAGDVPLLSAPVDTHGWGPPARVAPPAGTSLGVVMPLLPAPKLGTPLPAYGGISRTMQLLRTSTAAHRNRVFLAFYGQSITRQEWWMPVVEHLRQKYPNAVIEVSMLASGGQDIKHMRRASEHDIIPSWPDLIVYYNFGGYADLDGIVGDWRTRTTSEVLLQNWHVGAHDDQGVERMSYAYIPDVARRMGAEVLDQRSPWKRALGTGPPAQLLKDEIHLNAAGIALMAQIVNDYFDAFPETVPSDPLAMVSTYEVGSGTPSLAWRDGRLVADFDGTRLDAVAAPGVALAAGAAKVLVDGKPPSQHAGAYAFSRPNYDGKLVDLPEPGWPWTAATHGPLRVDHAAALQAEDWLLRITSGTASGFHFTVSGTVTGEDGEGDSTKPFRSRSGRVVIAPEDWFLTGINGTTTFTELPANNQVTWRALALHTDVYPPHDLAPPAPELESTVTLVQGLPPGKHRIELIAQAGDAVPLAALRVFRPPLTR